MQVGVLGHLVITDGPTTIPAGGAVQRRILARLGLEPGLPVSFDDLEQAAWGDDPPPASRHTIASHVFRLRRLGIEIDTTDDRYVLRTPTDLGELTRLAADSRSARECRRRQPSAGVHRRGTRARPRSTFRRPGRSPGGDDRGRTRRGARGGPPRGPTDAGDRRGGVGRGDRRCEADDGRPAVSRAALGAPDARALPRGPPGGGARRVRRVPAAAPR